MMAIVWLVLLGVGVLFGLLTGRADAVTTAALAGANSAVTTGLLLAGGYIMWMGLLNILEKARGIEALSRALRPITRRLFPTVTPNSAAEQAIATNISANLLGLGNAATPAGLTAMKELARNCPNGVASNDACMFLIVNSTSLQLLPTTIIALRAAAGALSPAGLLPQIALTTGCTAVVGITCAALFSSLSSRRALHRSAGANHAARTAPSTRAAKQNAHPAPSARKPASMR